MPAQPLLTTVQTVPPPRNLVLCLDGTGNQFSHQRTNVIKLFQVCERNAGQRIYYDPGVGTLGDAGYKTAIGRGLNKALGGAIGVGLMRNVEEAYTYLMDTYQPGDRIFLFGFSRGAYTARVLAGFINHCGLFEKGSQNLIPYAMGLFLERPPSKREDKGPFYALRSTFRRTYGRQFTGRDGKPSWQLPIHFLGLWDTVKSYGWLFDPVRIPGEEKNESVRTVRHAIALDEQRVFFPQMHWQRKGAHQDAREVWFAGVHQDVGGGYSEGNSGLSKIALDWMLDQAREAGLRLEESEYQHIVRGAPDVGKSREDKAPPDPHAAQHVSLQGPWRALEALPWRRADGSMCWHPRFKGDRARQVPDSIVVHRSVVLRTQQPVNALTPNQPAVRLGYLPAQLPALSADHHRALAADRPVLVPAVDASPAFLLLPLDQAARHDPWAGEILVLKLSERDHRFLASDWGEDREQTVRRLTQRCHEAQSEGQPDIDHLIEALATVAARWPPARRQRST